MYCLTTFLASKTPPLPQTKPPYSNPKPYNHQPIIQFARASMANALPASTVANGYAENPVKALPLPSHVKTITSTANPFVKHCVKLRESSVYRHRNGYVLVVGSTPIREIIDFQERDKKSTTIDCILVLDGDDLPEELDNSIHVVQVSSMVMKKISGLQSIDSIDMIALMRIPSTFHNVTDDLQDNDHPRWFAYPDRILVLDGIQDPGNLGTLLRTALAFRWNGAFLLPGCCDPFNEKALRASRGAAFQLPIVSGSWRCLSTLADEYSMKMLAGHPTSNGTLTTVSLLNQRYAHSVADTPLCLVLGSEGSGLSKKTVQECELISIPMEGNFESLNVSVAGGIFLYMLQQSKHQDHLADLKHFT